MTSGDKDISQPHGDAGGSQHFHLQQKSPNSWTVTDVTEWLSTVGLGELKEQFDQCAVDGEMLLYITQDELKEVLDIYDTEKIKIILQLTKELRPKTQEGETAEVEEKTTQLLSPVLEEAMTLTFGFNRGIIDMNVAISLLEKELKKDTPLQRDQLLFLLAYLLWERGARKASSEDVIRAKELLLESKDPHCSFYLGRCAKEENKDSEAKVYFKATYDYISTLTESELDNNLWAVWMKAYMDGEGFGTYKNEGAAIQGYVRCAAAGHALGQFSLGLAYSNGKGVPKDPQRGVEWYTKASMQGLAVAMCNLGNCYYIQDGIPRDDEESFRWYTRAAKAGHKPSQNWLTQNSRTW